MAIERASSDFAELGKLILSETTSQLDLHINLFQYQRGNI